MGFLRITSENVRPLIYITQFYEEIFKLDIFINKVGVFFKRNLFIREDAAFCFAVYFGFILV